MKKKGQASKGTVDCNAKTQHYTKDQEQTKGCGWFCGRGWGGLNFHPRDNRARISRLEGGIHL